MTKKYTYEDFVSIIERLRAKDGCPWDKEQTHSSLRTCVTEEAAELNAAVNIYEKTGNYGNLQEELGDVFLMVMMHSVIAKEEGLFDIDDVIQMISEKMIRRHPHVFGEETVSDTGEVLRRWDDIKKKEKEGQTWHSSPLRDIPVELPALIRGPKIAKKVHKTYEPLPTYLDLCNQMEEAINGMKDKALVDEVRCDDLTDDNRSRLQNEIGKLLMALTQVSYLTDSEPEQILTDEIEKTVEKWEPFSD